MGCNYLSLPLIPASGTTLLIYGPLCCIISQQWQDYTAVIPSSTQECYLSREINSQQSTNSQAQPPPPCLYQTRWAWSLDLGIPIKLPWIFPGAPLIFNGAPGNIQGKLTGMSRINWISLFCHQCCKGWSRACRSWSLICRSRWSCLIKVVPEASFNNIVYLRLGHG